MDRPTPVILSVSPLELPRLAIETSDSVRYYADLSELSFVYCFPKDGRTWEQVSIDSQGLALVWPNRFEVHVDQVIGLAYQTERVPKHASG